MGLNWNILDKKEGDDESGSATDSPCEAFGLQALRTTLTSLESPDDLVLPTAEDIVGTTNRVIAGVVGRGHNIFDLFAAVVQDPQQIAFLRSINAFGHDEMMEMITEAKEARSGASARKFKSTLDTDAEVEIDSKTAVADESVFAFDKPLILKQLIQFRRAILFGVRKSIATLQGVSVGELGSSATALAEAAVERVSLEMLTAFEQKYAPAEA